MAVMAIPFVQARNFTKGRSNKIDLLVIHTMETPEGHDTAESVAKWFGGSSAPQASAHYCIDDNTVVQCVQDGDVAWAAPGGNHDGLHFEHAGKAAQTKAEWNDEYSNKLLELSAQLVAQKCQENHIPVVWLLAADLKAGKRGITGHAQISEAFKRSDHTDPGKSFPVQRYLALVRKHMGESHVPEQEHRGRQKAAAQNPTLKEGAEGYQVKRLQRLLEQRGFSPGAADGIFGANTTKAVKKAQKENGLEADGIAGPLTWHALIAG